MCRWRKSAHAAVARLPASIDVFCDDLSRKQATRLQRSVDRRVSLSTPVWPRSTRARCRHEGGGCDGHEDQELKHLLFPLNQMKAHPRQPPVVAAHDDFGLSLYDRPRTHSDAEPRSGDHPRHQGRAAFRCVVPRKPPREYSSRSLGHVRGPLSSCHESPAGGPDSCGSGPVRGCHWAPPALKPQGAHADGQAGRIPWRDRSNSSRL